MPISVATLNATLTAQFLSDVKMECRTHKWNPNIVSELTAIATALGTDATVHDTTQQTAPLALRPGIGMNPGVAARSRFINDILLHVNQYKNFGQAYLTNAQMGTAITAALANILPPTISVAPVVSGSTTIGSTLTTTNGTWNFTPTTYRYQWLRAGQHILGATNSTYVTVQADHLLAVSCRVFAENAAGTGSADSNAISVA